MRRSHPTIGQWIGLAVAGTLALASPGCIPSTSDTAPTHEDPDARLEESIRVPDAPPEELIGAIRKASEKLADLTRKRPTSRDHVQRLTEIKRQIFTGIKAAEKLIAHPDCDQESGRTGRQMKLALLFSGVENDWTAFTPRLKVYVRQLVEHHPQSEEAALGAACLVQAECISGRATKQRVLAELADYAKNYPAHPAGVELFCLYGRKLQQQGDTADAKECYRRGVDLYGTGPQAGSLALQLQKLQRGEAQAAARRAQTRAAAEARIAKIKRRLGGAASGYFVIYAKENVAPPMHGGIYFYSYQYKVLDGRAAAVTYVNGLADEWSWELVRRFPGSAQGRTDAYDLWKRSLNKKRTGRD